MKKILLFLLASLAFVSCGVFTSTPEEDAATAAKVSRAVKDGDFVVMIQTIYPQRGMAIHSAGDYLFRYKDGVVNTRLPFFGVSDTPVFGTDESSIVLEDCAVDPAIRRTKDSYTMNFSARVGGNTLWHIELRIWDNGRADISARSASKSTMNYDGELIFRDENQ